MFLERPIERVTFICTVTMALMEARADRRSPRRAIRRFEASVNGVKSYIIDVSREGVRLELPRDRRMVTPHFALLIPLIGVGVSVQRVWVRVPRPDENVGVMWCGGQLAKNTALADQAWQRFIDTVASVAPHVECTHQLTVQALSSPASGSAVQRNVLMTLSLRVFFSKPDSFRESNKVPRRRLDRKQRDTRLLTTSQSGRPALYFDQESENQLAVVRRGGRCLWQARRLHDPVERGPKAC